MGRRSVTAGGLAAAGGVVAVTGGVSAISPPLRKCEALLPERQVALLQNLGYDIRTLLDLKVEEATACRPSLRREPELARFRLDVGELAVVPESSAPEMASHT